MVHRLNPHKAVTRFLGALGNGVQIGDFWTKLSHGFAGTLMEGHDHPISYEDSHAVGIRIEGLAKAFNGNQVLGGIDLEILPGETSFAFVGTRPPVPDQLSEPLLVIVDNATGRAITHSLWR